MPYESTCQILFIIYSSTFAILWVWNILSIGITRDKFYSATEGIMIALPRMLLLVASLVGIVLYSINPHLMNWSRVLLPFWLRICGLIIGLAALFLFFWVIRSLGHNFSTTLTIRRNQTLIIKGPYKWVRHPMYISFVLLWISFFLISINWFIGLTGILGFVLAIFIRTPKEENMMIERFGDEYIAYKQNTNRFLPRFWKKKVIP